MECPHCQKHFTNNRSIKYHLTHQVCQKSRFICTVCGRKFTTQKGLTYHNDNNVCVKHVKKIQVQLKSRSMNRTVYDEMSHEDLVNQLIHLLGATPP